MTLDILHRVRSTCLETERGFLLAADATGSLAPIFRHYAAQRHSFAEDLSQHIQRLGGTSVAPRVASRCYEWNHLHAAVRRHDLAGVIAECELGDRAASRIYTEALDAPLRADVRAALQRQLQQILETMSQVRRLRLGVHGLPQTA